jgi:hypothetical protein
MAKYRVQAKYNSDGAKGLLLFDDAADSDGPITEELCSDELA